jgi:phosphopantothenoylcysteine synthetase/decarboxylase
MHPRITVAAGGTIETALLPYHLVHLRAHYKVETRVALSQEAQHFATTLAFRGITKSEVYVENDQFDSSGTPLHLALSTCDLLVIYPCTPRIISEAANGAVSCCVTRLFAFTPKERIVVAPHIHPQLARSLYETHLERIEGLGCLILRSDTLWAPWADVELAIERKLGLTRRTPEQEVIQLAGEVGL